MKTEQYLYPRIASADARNQWEVLKDLSVDELIAQSDVKHPFMFYAATGGARIERDGLERLQNTIRAVAEAHGYPDVRKQKQAAEFDVACAEALFSEMRVSPGEAARDEVWSFIGLVLLPDVARWRFPKSNELRFVGGAGHRNALQRLWWRAYVLRDESEADQFHLLRRLPEDALVGIMERPGVSSNIALSREIARHAVDLESRVKRGSLEDARREAIVLVRRWIPVIAMDALSPELLRERLGEIYEGVGVRFAQ